MVGTGVFITEQCFILETLHLPTCNSLPRVSVRKCPVQW